MLYYSSKYLNGQIMNTEKLEQLLHQKEGPTLDFKRGWYKIDDPKTEVKTRQRDELIKDILSLANGNAASAGEPTYLIVGADDELDENGYRSLYDVGNALPTAGQILQIVNAACDPPIENVWCESVELDGKRILVITVPPSPHLHETTRKLETPRRTYTKHVVFVRHNESIAVASAKEREAIRALKKIRFAEMRNAPPILLGACVGAIIGAGMAGASVEELDDSEKINKRVAGGIVGGFVGGLLGNTYKDLRQIIFDWPHAPTRLRAMALAIFSASIAGSVAVAKVLKRGRD